VSKREKEEKERERGRKLGMRGRNKRERGGEGVKKICRVEQKIKSFPFSFAPQVFSS
jgi:hypothetical protein